MNKLDLIGHKYNRLLVLEETAPINGRRTYMCQCDCGTIKAIKMEHLRDGTTKSCGCLNDEKRSARAKAMYSVVIKYTPVEASARKIWQNYIRADKNRFGEIEILPFDQFYNITQESCWYCLASPANKTNAVDPNGQASENAKETGFFIYNGLDRIDSSKGHIKGNVVPCCKSCNYAKRDRTLQEYVDWIKQSYHRIVFLEENDLLNINNEIKKVSNE